MWFMMSMTSVVPALALQAGGVSSRFNAREIWEEPRMIDAVPVVGLVAVHGEYGTPSHRTAKPRPIQRETQPTGGTLIVAGEKPA